LVNTHMLSDVEFVDDCIYIMWMVMTWWIVCVSICIVVESYVHAVMTDGDRFYIQLRWLWCAVGIMGWRPRRCWWRYRMHLELMVIGDWYMMVLWIFVLMCIWSWMLLLIVKLNLINSCLIVYIWLWLMWSWPPVVLTSFLFVWMGRRSAEVVCLLVSCSRVAWASSIFMSRCLRLGFDLGCPFLQLF